jgi:hypothetical protein
MFNKQFTSIYEITENDLYGNSYDDKRRISKYGLSTVNILAACWLMPNVIDKCVGVFADDELDNIGLEITGQEFCCVCNTAPMHQTTGGHWYVVMGYVRNGRWELTYFCSLGRPMRATTRKVFEIMLGEIQVNDISRRYQHQDDDTLCGLYCLYAMHVRYSIGDDNKNINYNQGDVTDFYYRSLKSAVIDSLNIDEGNSDHNTSSACCTGRALGGGMAE